MSSWLPSSLRAKVIITSTVAVSLALALRYWVHKRYRLEKKEKLRLRKKQSLVNIGAVFGMDVGGTLTKIVYFEADREVEPAVEAHSSAASKGSGGGLRPLSRSSSSKSLAQLEDPQHKAALKELYSYVDTNVGRSGKMMTRDDNLCRSIPILGGRLHFLHFETRNMVSAISILSSEALIENIRSIGCTGGGAHKYAKEFEEQLQIEFNKFDELGCLIWGMYFALLNFKDECYTYREDVVKANDAQEVGGSGDKEDKERGRDKEKDGDKDRGKERGKEETPANHHPEQKDRWTKETKNYTKRVNLPKESLSSFPYLVVNIGSGVSIIKVTAPGQFTRVSGTSLGGGTYWGLCRLLTKCATFDEALDIAENGDAGLVDMMVKDIYGGDYYKEGGGKLSGSMVASSFGRLVMKENPREGVREEDLALALLMMITNNIGQVAYLNAQLHDCKKIYFVGSFLRCNPISCRRLAFAIDFWSKGAMEALFLVHEGYLGAMGTFLRSAFGDDVVKVLWLDEAKRKEQQSSGKLPKTVQDMLSNLGDSLRRTGGSFRGNRRSARSESCTTDEDFWSESRGKGKGRNIDENVNDNGEALFKLDNEEVDIDGRGGGRGSGRGSGRDGGGGCGDDGDRTNARCSSLANSPGRPRVPEDGLRLRRHSLEV